MKARPFLFLCRNDTVGEVFLDERFPTGALFIASIQPQVDRKAYRTTEIMAGHRIVGQWIGVVAVVVMAGPLGKKTAHMLAQSVIEDEGGVGVLSADPSRLLEEIRDATIVDLLLKPGCFREEAGQVRFVSALQHTAGNVGQAFVVQDDQARQIILEMVKLAPILEEVPEDVRMSSHQGSG